VFGVISVYFNLRNILPKSGTFLPGHPVYTAIKFAKRKQLKNKLNFVVAVNKFTSLQMSPGWLGRYMTRSGAELRALRRDFYLLLNFKTGFGTYETSYSKGKSDFFSRE
jgi:hypothetical protein